MFAPPTRAGTVCGWTPSNDSHDPFYTTISTTSSSYSHPLYAHPSLPHTSTTPRAVRNPIPRSLSLDSAVRPRSISDATDTTDTSSSSSSYQPYDNPTSARRNKAKRQQDPSWAPRPPNAFILFRRDYVTNHKGESDPSENKEKTLSKRAGDAWRSLPMDEKEPWFVRAKDEALSHAAAYPNYVFRPRKHQSAPRRHPALLSRREQVEEFVRKTSRRRALKKVTKRDRHSPAPFNCPTPGSAGSSSSPEPPGTPSSEESNPLTSSVPTGLQSRSDSLPARFDYPPIFAPPPNRAYMSQTAMLSMPSLAADHRPIAPKRSFSHSDMPPYSPWDYVNLGDEYSESDDTSIFSFESAPNEQGYHGVYLGGSSEQPSPANFEISLQGPDGQYMPEPQMPSPPGMPEPQVSSSIDPSTLIPPTNFAYPPPPASPLFERRRRAATISTLPSPLTVVTSSLSGWARDDLVTARMIPRADPAASTSSSSSSQPLQMPQPHVQLIVDNGNDWMRNIPQGMHETLAIPEADMEYTPRVRGFPQNIQSEGPAIEVPNVEYPMPEPQQQQQNIPLPLLDPYDISADLDLECYSLGLRQFGINNGGGEAANYSLASFDVDYASLFPEAGAQE